MNRKRRGHPFLAPKQSGVGPLPLPPPSLGHCGLAPMNGSPNKHHLSPAIDRALHRLMEERSLRPPDMNAYKALRSLPEQDAMTVIDDIASKKISNLSASILLGVKKIDPVRRIECNNFPVPLSLKSEPIEGDGSLGDLRFSNMGMPVSVNDSLKFRTSVPMVSEHLIALGKLEFRKAFLLLSYIGERKLEDVISVEKIHQLRDLDMFTFESQAWRAVQVGGGGITDGDRRLKQILYEAPEYEASTKPKEDILVEALAIYQVVYAHVKNLETSLVCNADENHSVGAGSNRVPGSRCQFAWRVAGAALCELHARLHNRESVLCSPVILKEMMGR